MVCPLRVFLVVFSTVIAGYFAWRTWGSHPSELSLESKNERLEQVSGDKTRSRPTFREVILKIFNWLRNASWTVVDMGTGRYLYTKWSERQRELAGHANSQRVGSQAKSSSIHAN